MALSKNDSAGQKEYSEQHLNWLAPRIVLELLILIIFYNVINVLL